MSARRKPQARTAKPDSLASTRARIKDKPCFTCLRQEVKTACSRMIGENPPIARYFPLISFFLLTGLQFLNMGMETATLNHFQWSDTMTKFSEMTASQRNRWLAWANSHDWGVPKERAKFIQHETLGFVMVTACAVCDPQGMSIERGYSATPSELRAWARY